MNKKKYQHSKQVGYQYKYHKKIDQFAHAAVLMFLTPDGQISRYLYGIDFKYNDLKLALLEASEGKIGSALEKVLLFCFEYDPDSQSYSFMLMSYGFCRFYYSPMFISLFMVFLAQRT